VLDVSISGRLRQVEPFDEARDATRRTRLANERTYLAWWRSGLTSLAVAVGAGKIAPEVTGGSSWPYQILGAGFALLGVTFVAYGFVRQRAVENALREGKFAPLDVRISLTLTVATMILGIATVVLVLVEG
jgi:putative membrane protein